MLLVRLTVVGHDGRVIEDKQYKTLFAACVAASKYAEKDFNLIEIKIT